MHGVVSNLSLTSDRISKAFEFRIHNPEHHKILLVYLSSVYCDGLLLFADLLTGSE